MSRGSKKKLGKLVRKKKKKNKLEKIESTSRFVTTSMKMTQRRAEVEYEGFQASQRDKDIISSALRNLTPRAVDSQQNGRQRGRGWVSVYLERSANYLEEINQPGTA